jgi:hypothetical protein
MWDNPEIGEVLLAGTVVLVVAGVVCLLLLRMTAPPKRSRYAHSLESRLQGVVGGRMRELELKPYAELAALPAAQREDKLSPSGRRFYIQTSKARQADGTLAITVQVGEVKWLGLGVRVSETLYASPPETSKPPN